MKLHLPARLRKAVLACLALAGVYATTIGTGIVAGGVLATALVTQQAEAALTSVADMGTLVAAGTSGQGVVNSTTANNKAVSLFAGSGGITGIESDAVINALNGTSGFVTIAAWVKEPDSGNNAFFSVGAQQNGFKFGVKSNKPELTYKGIQDYTTGAHMAVPQNEWSLVALTIDLDKTGSDSYFFVGSSGGNLTQSGSWDFGGWKTPSPAELAIGSGRSDGDWLAYKGMISNLTIFTSNTAATAEELKAAMGNSFEQSTLTWNTSASADNQWKGNAWQNNNATQGWADASNAVFSGAGETISLSGNVLADTVNVIGSGWEWTGDGTVGAYHLAVGDGTTAADLTISITGNKSFATGVSVAKDCTLIVKDAANWVGAAYGEGTVELAMGTETEITQSQHVLMGLLGITADRLGTLALSNGTVINHNTVRQDYWRWMTVANTIDVREGARITFSTGGNYLGSGADSLYKIAGKGTAGAEAGTSNAAALSFNHDTTVIRALELTDDATLYVENGCGAQFKETPVGDGFTLTKTGAGELILGQGESTVARTDNPDISVSAGTLTLNLAKARQNANYDGDISLANGTTLKLDNGTPTFTGALNFDGNVTIANTKGEYTYFSGNISGDTDTSVTLSNDKAATNGQVTHSDFNSANTFAGTWKVDGDWVLYANHEQAFEFATVELNNDDSSLFLATDKVKIGALNGDNGTLQCKFAATPVAEFGTTGTAEFTGDISPGISIVMNGPGEQIIKTFDVEIPGFKADVTVKQGTLTITDGLRSANRTITLAPGSTLNNALTLNGGSLILDISGAAENAASLKGNTLTLVADSGTALSLSLADDVKTGQTFTLLQDITGLTLANEDTLGDYFTPENITIVSENSVQRADITPERLAASSLFVDGGALKFTLAPGVVDTDPLYWDTADGSGNGNWSSNNWSAEDALGVDPAVIADGWSGSVVFSDRVGDTIRPDTVNVDTAAQVDNLTVEGGNYIFTKTATGSLSIDGTLDVRSGATADMSALGNLSMDTLTNAGTLSAAGLEVATGLTQTTGSLSADKISGTGSISITGGTLELTDNTDALAVTGSVSIEDATLAGNWKADGLTLGAATLANGADITLSNLTVGDTINTDEGTLSLGGKVVVDRSALQANGVSILDSTVYNDGKGNMAEDNNGYAQVQYEFALVTNNAALTIAGDSIWESEGATVTATKNTEEDTITIRALELGHEYIVRNGTVTYTNTDTAFDRATALVLGGGHLLLNSAPATNMADGIKVRSDGNVTVAQGISLSADQLDNTAGHNVTLLGSGTYNLKNSTVLGNGVAVGADDSTGWWFGTVTSAAGNVADISSLGNSRSTVQLTSNVSSATLSTGTIGTLRLNRNLSADTLSAGNTDVYIGGVATLRKGNSQVHNATFSGGLTLGTADSTATLSGNSLSLTSLTIGSLGSQVVATELTESTLAVYINSDVLSTLPAGQTEQLIRLTNDSSLATLSLNGDADGTLENAGAKYFYTLSWVEEGGADVVIITSALNENYITEKFADTDDNAQTGAELLSDAFVNRAPQTGRAATTDLDTIIDAIEGNHVTEEGLAAVAGASVSSLGMALSGDVERQLRAIRNRTTTMGVNPCVYNDNMPYYNAWVNAEGNHSELSKDGNHAGYTLDNWGGTVGLYVDMNDHLTVGLALTAMYGDLQADGPEAKAEGDMDTAYVSLFARYADCAWTHTFVATLGMMDGSFERTVDVGNGYSTKGSTDGMGFGLLYELGYVMQMDEGTYLQPIFNVMLRHSSVGSFTEEGSNAALDVGSQSMTTLTFGLGARMQAVVGENLYNRSSIFEARALAKVDVGDRSSEANVAFVGGSGFTGTVESAELGAFGIELGAGITIPLGAESGSVFMDGSVELRSGYTNLNGTVGYRVEF
ncbi:MAG: autotransporter domain-containing protein [Akkermansia sp.]|nr:autotransporter domain-containing protein [Akkermansia sp.]